MGANRHATSRLIVRCTRTLHSAACGVWQVRVAKMQSILYMEYTLHVHTRIKEESYIVRSHRSESSTGHESMILCPALSSNSSRHQSSSRKSRIRMCACVLNWIYSPLEEEKKVETNNKLRQLPNDVRGYGRKRRRVGQLRTANGSPDYCV